MDNNKKAVAIIFDNEANYKEIVTNTYYKIQEYIEDSDDDMTAEQAIEQFKCELDTMFSEFIAEKLLGVDMEDYYETHNNQLTADVLQAMIDEESDDE